MVFKMVTNHPIQRQHPTSQILSNMITIKTKYYIYFSFSALKVFILLYHISFDQFLFLDKFIYDLGILLLHVNALFMNLFLKWAS